MSRRLKLAALVGGGMAAFAVVRHFRGGATGHRLQGGIVMGNASAYDAQTGFLLGSFYRSIAADVASVTSHDARILEIGCGPGRLRSDWRATTALT